MSATIKLLDACMKLSSTDPELRECMYHYAMGRGGMSMIDICRSHGYDQRYRKMAWAQDEIGWRRFMAHGKNDLLKLQQIQQLHLIANGLLTSGKRWA